ncbi:hypothetical protein AB0D12_31715 [Streptomyces sp. NPDC048479]|uniref:hypothetical protein n=1 Tax=Streptomyces sp. NPDC048479 TaxID=3154725 RepID=UPI00344238E9
MPASKAQQAATAKRRASAIALRLAGMDFDTIADRLEYASRQAASKDVCRALDANRLEEKEQVEQLRHVEGLRLDRLQAAVWPKAIKGDLKAVETVRRLIAERIRLFGVAEPVRTELSGPGGGPVTIGPTTAAELQALISAAGDGDPDPDNAGDGLDDDGLDGDDDGS